MRGKAAAQSANRRLSEALARIEQLELQLSEQAAAHKRVVTDLQTDLQRVQGSATRDIKRLSDDRVQAERDRANLAIGEARAAHLAQVVAGVAKLDSIRRLATDRLDQWTEVAEHFGVDVGPLISGMMELRGDSPSRNLARTSNAGARWKARVIDGIAKGDLAYNPGPHKVDRWRES